MTLYKHTKTGNIYQVLHFGEHTETHEKLVIYQRYPQDGTVPSTIWCRPVEMFMGDVEIDGKMVTRFQKVD